MKPNVGTSHRKARFLALFLIILPPTYAFTENTRSQESRFRFRFPCFPRSLPQLAPCPRHNSQRVHQTVRAQSPDDENENEPRSIRLNKVLKANYSRRQADALIASGRVTVNGEAASAGQRVIPFQDTVQLDGTAVIGWEAMNGFVSDTDGTAVASSEATSFVYVKYWKPLGVVCTTDPRIPHNILHALQKDGYVAPHRVYPIGRLDRDTSGLILLTSNGRLPNVLLRGQYKQPKTYEVRVDRPVCDRDVCRLRQGVVITTVAVRDGKRAAPYTAPTRPCHVEPLEPRTLRMTITEGRNRQVRKMLAALGYSVVSLERTAFAGIVLDPLKGPGDWSELDGEEMEWIHSVLRRAERDST